MNPIVEHYDIIIIGAGAMGSAAAYYLSSTTKNVLLLDQFELAHSRGSTHGESRVIRKTYTEPHFAEMMKTAYELWQELENISGIEFYQKTGGIDFGSADNEDLRKTIEVCETQGIHHEILSLQQLQARFPAFVFSDSDIGVYQPDTGIVNPQRVLTYFHKQAKRNGVRILDNTKVTQLKRSQPLQIHTDQDSFSCETLIITSGSWINSLLNPLGYKLDVKIWHMGYGFFKTESPEQFKQDTFPVFINWDKEIFYGFPINEKAGCVKIAPHLSGAIPKLDHHKPSEQHVQQLIDRLQLYVRQRFEGLEIDPKLVETCYYTMTPTENFIIDWLPKTSNIIIAAGFSGHGFKFTPLIGTILADMALGRQNKWVIEEFNISNVLI